MFNNPKRLLLVLFFLALAVRLIIAFNTYAISSDGPLYVEAASYYYQGDFKNGLAHPYHPLYPFLISLVYRLIGDWEWAGLLIPIILSSIAVIPLYLIGLRLFNNQKIALISSIFYIFHPHLARLSSSMLTTGTFIFILVTAIYFLMKALDSWHYTSFGLSGLFSLLAFLTRPDGIIILFMFLAWIVFIRFSGWWKGEWKRKVSALLFFILPWLLVALPYIVYLVTRKGEFTISNKFTLTGLVTFVTALTNLNAFHMVAEDFIKCINPWLLILILIGIIIPRRELIKTVSRRNAWIIWSLFIVYTLFLLKFGDAFYRTSKRYTTPLVAIIIFWGAIGIYLLISKLVKDKIEPEKSPLFVKGLVIGVLLTIISFAVFTFQPIAKDRLVEKEAGKWIKQYHQGKEQPVVVADSNRIPYYAGAKILQHYEATRLRKFGNNYTAVINNLHKFKADYLVIDKKEVDSFIPDFTSRLNSSGMEQIYPPTSNNADKKQILFIYRVKQN